MPMAKSRADLPRRKLRANSILRLFECEQKWNSEVGPGLLTGAALANCVTNELSSAFMNSCGRACSSVMPGHETRMLKPKSGVLGILLNGSSVAVVGAFPHDADTIGHHGCMLHHRKCNVTTSNQRSARVYAQARHAVARAACAKGVDAWSAHRVFLYRPVTRTFNCMHSTRQAAEAHQKAYFDLLARKPLVTRGGRHCRPRVLWNQMMVKWKLTDVVGVVYSADSSRAATHVRDAIWRLDKVFSIQRPNLRMYLVSKS